MFSETELRRAIFALQVIDDRGDRHVVDAIFYDAAKFNEDPRRSMTVGLRLQADEMARRLSRLFGAPLERCEAVVAETWGQTRQRFLFDEIIRYAISLSGPCVELTGNAPSVHPQDTPRPQAAPRPSLRIVDDDSEGRATA
jgi:hypothetical protein